MSFKLQIQIEYLTSIDYNTAIYNNGNKAISILLLNIKILAESKIELCVRYFDMS